MPMSPAPLDVEFGVNLSLKIPAADVAALPEPLSVDGVHRLLVPRLGALAQDLVTELCLPHAVVDVSLPLAGGICLTFTPEPAPEPEPEPVEG